MYGYKMKPRQKGVCPSCGKSVAIKKGVGPYALGRGDVFEHKPRPSNKFWCIGGQAIK